MVTATKRHRSSSSPRRPATRSSRQPAEISAAARPVAQDVAVAHGLVLWGVTFLRDAGRETLRVAVDRVGGVGSDDLALYSEQLSREIDRADVVPGDARYTLEVTSPGAERKLETPEQFRICVGRVAKVVLDDGRTIEGPITAVTDNAVELDGEGGPVRALFEGMKSARLVVKI
jgi:ribosome maturation factor RimP